MQKHQPQRVIVPLDLSVHLVSLVPPSSPEKLSLSDSSGSSSCPCPGGRVGGCFSWYRRPGPGTWSGLSRCDVGEIWTVASPFCHFLALGGSQLFTSQHLVFEQIQIQNKTGLSPLAPFFGLINDVTGNCISSARWSMFSFVEFYKN